MESQASPVPQAPLEDQVLTAAMAQMVEQVCQVNQDPQDNEVSVAQRVLRDIRENQPLDLAPQLKVKRENQVVMVDKDLKDLLVYLVPRVKLVIEELMD